MLRRIRIGSGFRRPSSGRHTSALTSASLDDADHLNEPDDRRGDHREQPRRESIVLAHDLEGFHPTDPVLDPHAHLRHLDRKSTRLNSSHLGISYAVFCLKKKKKKK